MRWSELVLVSSQRSLEAYDGLSVAVNMVAHDKLTSPVNFTVVQSNNVSIVYVLDSYRPIAGEVVVTQAAFKGIILQLRLLPAA